MKLAVVTLCIVLLHQAAAFGPDSPVPTTEGMNFAEPEVFERIDVSHLMVNTTRAASWPANNYGVDVSSRVSTSSWRCLRSANLVFAIPRCFRSNGRTDSNCASNVANAWAGGMAHVDIYAFPCPRCSASAASQAASLASYVSSNRVRIGQLWIDVEGSQYWSSSQSSNRAWFESYVRSLKGHGFRLGLYSSASQWGPIMGSSYSYARQQGLPLWYAQYDGKPTFSGFRRFGGYTTPSIKQFSDAGSKCSVRYDLNWYP